MVLKIYNTLTRKKDVFKPLKKDEVKMYSCGLTVYNYGHIGNYRAFVVSDILRRYLEFKSYEVKKIVNITDVDDKTIKNSINEGKALKDYTKKYEDAFFEDEKSLNIKPAFKYPRATEHISEMVELIDKLLKKGYAYKADDGIYFKVSKFKDYGKLAKIEFGGLKEGGSERVSSDEYDKENAKDFALWKFYNNEDGDVFWNTKLGKGRPGWHIECSAMSSKYLGQPFDIHTGGIDLVFPHHENEIAQSEAGNGKKFANYWLHNEWLMVNGKKMSKSLGNQYNLRDIQQMSYKLIGLRYFYLTGQYRTQLNFTFDNLKNAENSYERLKRIIEDIKDRENSKNSQPVKINNNQDFSGDNKINEKYLQEFEKAMDDDLDTVKGLQILWKLVRDEKAIGKINTIKKIDDVLGLDLLKKEEVKISNEVQKLIDEREKVRKNKDFKKSDELRDKINKAGYKIDDTKDGVKISKP